MWSYHWQSSYALVLMPLWKWAYNNPWYISRYYCNYYFGEWRTCLEGSFPPFLSPHLTMNGYPYHHKQLSNFDGHCYYWLDLDRYGAMNIDDNITCNNDDCLGENTIVCPMNIKQWFHAPCYRDVWASSFLFWFVFNCLCIDHYRASSMAFFSPFNACFLIIDSACP
jgi:hypothetical protein